MLLAGVRVLETPVKAIITVWVVFLKNNLYFYKLCRVERGGGVATKSVPQTVSFKTRTRRKMSLSFFALYLDLHVPAASPSRRFCPSHRTALAAAAAATAAEVEEAEANLSIRPCIKYWKASNWLNLLHHNFWALLLKQFSTDKNSRGTTLLCGWLVGMDGGSTAAAVAVAETKNNSVEGGWTQ